MSSIEQGTDVLLEIFPLLDGKPPVSISAATYIIYNRSGTVLSKTLGNGITYLAGKLEVTLLDSDTVQLMGAYSHECIARTTDGIDFFPLSARPIQVNKTIARIQ